MHWLEKALVLLTAETADLRELATMADGDPRTFYLGVDPARLDTRGQNLSGMLFGKGEEIVPSSVDEVGDFLTRVYRAKRKEERVALLLRQLLVTTSSGRPELLRRYPRSTAFEATASQRLKRVLDSAPASPLEFEADVANVAASLFKPLVMEGRGLFLYFLALHTSQSATMRNFVKRRLSRTTSHHILRYDEEIRRALKNSEQ